MLQSGESGAEKVYASWSVKRAVRLPLGFGSLGRDGDAERIASNLDTLNIGRIACLPCSGKSSSGMRKLLSLWMVPKVGVDVADEGLWSCVGDGNPCCWPGLRGIT